MDIFNALICWVADFLLAPLSSMPLLNLLFWSGVSGLIMAFVFGRTSNQRALRRVADRTRAQLLAIKLFKDDLGVTFRCQVELFKATGWRLFYSLTPTLVMVLPFVLVLIQLARWYEYQPAVPGKAVRVEMDLAPDVQNEYKKFRLERPAGVRVTGPHWDMHQRVLSWRLDPDVAGLKTLRWRWGDQALETVLVVADSPPPLVPLTVVRSRSRWWQRLLHPGEPGLAADSPIESLTTHYRLRKTPIFGIQIPWWATFLVMSMSVAFLVGRWMGVQF